MAVAGAARAWWVRTEQGRLAEAIPAIRRKLAESQNAILESNSILKFLRPDLYLTVLDPATADFKKSAQEFMDRADAIILHEAKTQAVAWRDISLTESARWISPRSRASYPAAWRIAVARLKIDVAVEPILADQELDTSASTGVTYWEGACRVRGTRAGRPVSGRAYAELTGYGGRDVPGLAGLTARGARSVSASAATSFFRSASFRPSGRSSSRFSGSGRRRGTGS